MGPSLVQAGGTPDPIELPPPPAPPGPPHPFTDIKTSGFKIQIAWLYNTEITGGCSATKFCPSGDVTREQMASFLVRSLGLPATSQDFYSDDNSSPHEGDINRLAKAGITGGCATNRYCPRALVTREQMASFLVRALGLPGTSTDYFRDDESSIHESNINRLARSGITGGCASGRFCPKAAVKREQMAAFLFRALAEYLPGTIAASLAAPSADGPAAVSADGPAITGGGDPYPSFPDSQLVCSGGSVYASAPHIHASTFGVGGQDAYVWWRNLLFYWSGTQWVHLGSSTWFWSPVYTSDAFPGSTEGVAGPPWYPQDGSGIVTGWISWTPTPGYAYAIVHAAWDSDSSAVNVSYTAGGGFWCVP